MAKESEAFFSLKIQKEMARISFKKSALNEVTLDGLLTVGMLETGQHTLDFMCCEDVATEPFSGDFRVQAMRDGNVYMQQKPKRQRNRPIFREDNSSLSLGRDGRYYFCFSIDCSRAGELPQQLTLQASSIAQKVTRAMFEGHM